MDIWTYGSDWLPESYVEGFNTFIWTERYITPGDFEIDFYPTNTTLRTLLVPGRYLGHAFTKYPMIIETADFSQDADGDTVIKVSGRAAYAPIFEGRVENVLYDTDTGGNKFILPNTATAADQIVYIAYEAAGQGGVDDLTSIMSFVNVSSGGSSYTYRAQYRSALAGMLEQAAAGNVGIRMSIQTSDRVFFNFFLEIYAGVRRNNVAFSKQFDSLTSSSYVTSQANYYNIARVYHADHSYTDVPATGISTSITGFARRVLGVDASSIDPTKYTSATFNAMIKKAGQTALASHKKTGVITGTIPPDAPYKYGTHYNLGDVVSFVGDYGGTQTVRVTEYIWAIDGQGFRAYPTFVDTDND